MQIKSVSCEIGKEIALIFINQIRVNYFKIGLLTFVKSYF